MKRLLLPVMLVMLLGFVVQVVAQEDTEANKALVARYTEEFFNKGNTDLMAEFFADDLQIQDSRYGRVALSNFATAIRPLTMQDSHLFAQNDLVAQLYMLTGTQNDRTYSTPEFDVLRIEDGKIAQIWMVWDYTYFALGELGGRDGAGLLPELPEGWLPEVAVSATTPDENLALVERAIDIWKTGNTDTLAEVYADDVVFHFPPSVSAETLDSEGLAAYIDWLHTAMPNFSIETDDHFKVAGGNLVLYCYKWSGRSAPEAETRLSIRAEASDLYRIEDGKIAEVWWLWDARGYLGSPSVFAPPEAS